MRIALVTFLLVNASVLFGQSKPTDSGTDDGLHGTLINDAKSAPVPVINDKTLVNDVKADTWQNVDSIKAPGPYENIYNRPLYSDSLSSSFAILVKNEVKEHRHEKHSENILVLDGEAVMKVDGKSFKIKKGDIIFVPKNTWHYVKVTSKAPLKVISIQSPNFDGKDRVYKENK